MRNYQKISLYNPLEAVKISRNLFREKGFYLASKSSVDKDYSSIYMRKIGYPYKIRISDHKMKDRKVDVKFDIVFDYPTTFMDIQYTVDSIVKKI